jgi:aldose 1-epimerase
LVGEYLTSWRQDFILPILAKTRQGTILPPRIEGEIVPFQIAWENRPNDERVAVLSDARNRLEIWPALGFNAYRWQVAGLELLYRSPQFFTEHRPTRSGFPILFPFPNRIRDGRFEVDGKSYQLPLGDPAGKNAIHGFAFNRPWRVIDQGASATSAFITAEFHGSLDLPETRTLWPADYRARVTYRLLDHVLRVEADVDNPDTAPLPFGFGYHPYFAVAPFGGAQAIVTVAAGKHWELVENLPTGAKCDLDVRRDLRQGERFSTLTLDDVMTDLYTFAYDQEDALGLVAVIQHPAGERMLTLWTTGDFRELVLFTPPHREAICIEPYTCTTDAINLSARGIDAGWRVLKPGERWQGIVEMHVAT